MAEGGTGGSLLSVVEASVFACWGVLFLLVAAGAIVNRPRLRWRWRKTFRVYLGLSFVLVATYLASKNLIAQLVPLAVGHLLPLWLAGRDRAPEPPTESETLTPGGFKKATSSLRFAVQVLGGGLGLIFLALSFVALKKGMQAHPLPPDAPAAPGSSALHPTGAPRIVDTIEPGPDGSAQDAGPRRVRGVGYRVQGNVFESAASGLRIEAPPGFSFVTREEAAVGVNGPEVTVVGGERGWFRLYSESVPAPSEELGIKRYLAIASGARELADSKVDPKERWQLAVLGRSLPVLTSRAPEAVTRDTYLWAGGRAYRFSIETETDRPETRAMAEAVLEKISWLSPQRRSELRAELLPQEVTQSQVGSDFVIRGRKYQSFRYGLSWTAPEGLWRFAPEEATRQLLSNTALFAANDQEGGVTVCLSVEPSPKGARAIVTQWLARLTKGAAPSPLVRKISKHGQEIVLGTTAVTPWPGVTVITSAASWTQGQSTFLLSVDYPPGTLEEDSAALEAVLNGFEVHTVTSAEEHMGGAYIDHRLGYSFSEPPGWKFERLGPIQGPGSAERLKWSHGSFGDILIEARFVAEFNGEPAELTTPLFESTKANALAHFPGPFDENETSLGGLPARHLHFRSGEFEGDWFVVARGKVGFIVAALGRGTSAGAHVRRGLRFPP
jgi:hypothetical protein